MYQRPPPPPSPRPFCRPFPTLTYGTALVVEIIGGVALALG
jgi:hypothetical protein